MRARASSSVKPRYRTSRSTWTSTGTSTTILPCRSRSRVLGQQRDVEHDDLVGRCQRIDSAIDLGADRRVHDRVEVAQRIGVVEDDRRQLGAPQCTASSSSTSSPNRSAIASTTGDPGCCTSRVMASASMISAPRAASIELTVDFPEPIPPVSPTRIIGAMYPVTGSGARSRYHLLRWEKKLTSVYAATTLPNAIRCHSVGRWSSAGGCTLRHPAGSSVARTRPRPHLRRSPA